MLDGNQDGRRQNALSLLKQRHAGLRAFFSAFPDTFELVEGDEVSLGPLGARTVTEPRPDPRRTLVPRTNVPSMNAD